MPIIMNVAPTSDFGWLTHTGLAGAVGEQKVGT